MMMEYDDKAGNLCQCVVSLCVFPNTQQLRQYMLMWCHSCQGKIGEPMPDMVCLCACHCNHTGKSENLHWCGECVCAWVRMCPEEMGKSMLMWCVCVCVRICPGSVWKSMPRLCACVCVCAGVFTRTLLQQPPPSPLFLTFHSF